MGLLTLLAVAVTAYRDRHRHPGSAHARRRPHPNFVHALFTPQSV